MFWFTASDGTLLYMGKDKFENEDLIKHGWVEDIWFHVDGLSSAHVYARILPPGSPAAKVSGVQAEGSGEAAAPSAPSATAAGGGGGYVPPPMVISPPATLDSISEAALRDCAQLVKANSLEGCKKGTVTVIYTLWSNLRKDGSMASGQVAFHNERAVRRVTVGERDKELLSRLAKTRQETQPDLAKERERRDAMERSMIKALQKAKSATERQVKEGMRRDKEERSYERCFEGSSVEERVKAEKARMAELAAKALSGGGRGEGEEEEEEEEEDEEKQGAAVSRQVRAVEEDFM